MPSAGLLLRVGAFLILASLLASSSYWSSAASSSGKASINHDSASALDEITAPVAAAGLSGSTSIRAGNYLPLFTLPQASSVTVTTYESDCSTPKTVFNLQDADKTICAKVTGAQPSWQIIWSNADSIAVQNVPVGSGTSTFTLTAASNLGDWRVILFEPFGGSVQKVASFTVIDAANPKADVSISKGLISGSVSAGAQVIFSLQITNAGPSDAVAVQLLDGVPSNTTFVSFDQLIGPTFTCDGQLTGTSCTIGDLARGESATFVATYLVGTVSNGTEISNTATVTSTTPDPNSDNNSSTATTVVSATPCQLSSPNNITVNADGGQAGAVVIYETPSGTGDCGQPTPGENGGTVPPISCNPQSGSFFPVGTALDVNRIRTV